jgi:hypothetical protein
VASSSQTFQQVWRIGRQVQEKAAPHRKGTIRSRAGTGANAQITVNITGRAPVTFHPAQLTPL